MFGPKHQWKWRIPLFIATISVLLVSVYKMTTHKAIVPQPVVYTMPDLAYPYKPRNINTGRIRFSDPIARANNKPTSTTNFESEKTDSVAIVNGAGSRRGGRFGILKN